MSERKKEMIIQGSVDEIKVALLEDGHLVQYDMEHQSQAHMVGSIFKGQVESVLPGMQAAFVDVGLDKNAFLYIDEAIPENYPAEVKPQIQSLLKEGQEVMVQVIKEAVGSKGPRITRKITLPGQYMVLMPEADYVGVSRKIGNEVQRERMKALAETIRGEQTMGLIMRTAAEQASLAQLQSEFDRLLSAWLVIEARAKTVKVPSQIHQDEHLVKRVLRDMFTRDVGEIMVNTSALYEQVWGILQSDRAGCKIQVKECDLFLAYNLYSEIEKALKSKVWLKNGGYIVIDQTEALSSIDVNTGKYVGKKDVQETITTMNVEAAAEIARQIRLRNLGGIIIIDFIDMLDLENRQRVLDALDEHLQRDKIKSHVLGITELGLVELTRKKVGLSLAGMVEKTCPYCQGKGRILSEETVVLRIRAQLREMAGRTEADGLTVWCHPLVAAQLIGANGRNLNLLSSELKKKVVVQGDSLLHREAYSVLAAHQSLAKQGNRPPVLVNQLFSLLIAEINQASPDDGIGRVDGFMIMVEHAARLVGERVLVEITQVFETSALAKVLE